MAASLTFDILARDRASATLNRVGTATANTGKRFDQFKTAATAVGLVAGAALVKFGKDSVRAFKESQDAQLRLEDAFARFPNLADSNIESFQKLNQQLQLKTKFDDEAYASGQAILAQFKLTGKQIEQVTPLLGDYAAKVGIDVPQAAKLLGKAFLGNTRALKTLGISYKTTGNQALDTANIIDLVRQKVGGFAEKEGKTAAGQVAILGNKFEELQEKVGAKLVPALVGVVSAASKVLDIFGDLSPETQQVVLAMTALAVATLLVGPRIASLATNLKVLGASAKTAGLGFAAFAAALLVMPALIRITNEATDSSQSWIDRLKGVNKQIIDTLDPTDKLSSALGLNADNAQKTAGATDAAKTAASQYQGVINALTPTVAGLAEETQNAYEAQQRLNGVMLTATETDIAVRDAVASWAQKVREATKAGEKHTHSLSLNNQAGRDNISALTDMAKKVNAHAQAVFDQTGSLGKANKALLTDRKRLLDAGVAAGFNRDELAKLINKYLKVPTKAQTKIEQPGIVVAKARADALKNKMDSIEGTYNAHVRASVTGLGAIDNLQYKLGQLPTAINISVGARVTLGGASLGRQHGGNVLARHAYIVGERRRPELFVPNQNGRIEPRISTAAAISSGDGRLHPADIRALVDGIGRVVLAGISAAGVASARRADLYARAG